MISIKDLNLKLSQKAVFQNFNWRISQGENWLITGHSGAGKTSLFGILSGAVHGFKGTVTHNFENEELQGIYTLQKHASFVFFKDKSIAYKDFYYQQRYNSSDVEGTFTVKDFLFKGQKQHHQAFLREMSSKLKIDNLMDREYIKLSNGETRKISIIKALLNDPEILFLDNPYRGIDVPGRKVVNELIDQIAAEGIQIVMAGAPEVNPACITHVMELDHCKEKYCGSASGYFQDNPAAIEEFPGLSFEPNDFKGFEIAFQFSDLNIRYGETSIIDQLNWTVKEGEKWVLSGANGSGKSMLLSMVFADHPQAYANEIIIFGKRKGQGGSIWDIKEKVAYVSPEMLRYFGQHKKVEEVFASVLQENPYNKKTFTDEHKRLAVSMLQYFGKEHLISEKFGTLSCGEQSLVMFLRALIKNAPLLLLDEPFQDFDPEMVGKAKQLLGNHCKDRTLVMITHNENEIPEIVTHRAELRGGVLR